MSIEGSFPFDQPDWRDAQPKHRGIKKFLMEQPTWADLPPLFQHITIRTTEEIVDASPKETIAYALSLDQDTSPYILFMRIYQGGLINFYETIQDTLDEERAQFFLKIKTAERLAGNRLAQSVSWSPSTHFGTYTLFANHSIFLNIKTVQKFS